MNPPDPSQNKDYINANYMSSGLDGCSQRYIATQAPSESSMKEFWCMVWEQEIELIVMLTQSHNVAHDSKSIDYWPCQGQEIDIGGGRRISCTEGSMNLSNDSVLTCINIHASETVETRVVRHLLFNGWRDHQVPDMSSFVLFYCQYLEQKAQNTTNAPILVHCSAGIGRTGTFLSIDILFEYIKSELSKGKPLEVVINPASVVYELRQQRHSMVQNLLQYRFIFEYLSHCYKHNLISTRQIVLKNNSSHRLRRNSSAKRHLENFQTCTLPPARKRSQTSLSSLSDSYSLNVNGLTM